MVIKPLLVGVSIASLALPCLAENKGEPAFQPPSSNGLIVKNANEVKAGLDSCTGIQSRDEREDCVRNTARAFPLGTIKNVKVKNSHYFDADGKICTGDAGPRLTESGVRFFIKNSVPVSQMAVMNYYGQQGECSSENVKITFSNGRTAHFSLSSEGKVGYISPLQKGKETDVFFYYCEPCSK
jgi:hypothetical protein